MKHKTDDPLLGVLVVKLDRPKPCPDCGCRGAHFCTGKPSKGPTAYVGHYEGSLEELYGDPLELERAHDEVEAAGGDHGGS
jgi:hypothetical protein